MAHTWVEIPTDTLKAARNERGWSYETAGREFNVSSKTYERREKDGRWPLGDLNQLVEIYELMIERPALETIKLSGQTADDDRTSGELLALVQEGFADLRAGQAEISRRLALLEGDQSDEADPSEGES